jgi:hypothetical protein
VKMLQQNQVQRCEDLTTKHNVFKEKEERACICTPKCPNQVQRCEDLTTKHNVFKEKEERVCICTPSVHPER